MTRPSPVPDGVADELTRVVRRWQQLPLDHALSGMPQAYRLVLDLAGEPVPDLGPAVVMDQLAVMVFDACAHAEEATPVAADLVARLTALRRALR